jgi:hypothetical protein
MFAQWCHSGLAWAASANQVRASAARLGFPDLPCSWDVPNRDTNQDRETGRPQIRTRAVVRLVTLQTGAGGRPQRVLLGCGEQVSAKGVPVPRTPPYARERAMPARLRTAALTPAPRQVA